MSELATFERRDEEYNLARREKRAAEEYISTQAKRTKVGATEQIAALAILERARLAQWALTISATVIDSSSTDLSIWAELDARFAALSILPCPPGSLARCRAALEPILPLIRDLLHEPYTLDLSKHRCVRSPLGARSKPGLRTMQIYIRRCILGTSTQDAQQVLERFARTRPADLAWTEINTELLESSTVGSDCIYGSYVGITGREIEMRTSEDESSAYRAIVDFATASPELHWSEFEVDLDVWVSTPFGERSDPVIQFAERVLIAALGANSFNRAMGGSRPAFVVDSQEQHLIDRVQRDLAI